MTNKRNIEMRVGGDGWAFKGAVEDYEAELIAEALTQAHGKLATTNKRRRRQTDADKFAQRYGALGFPLFLFLLIAGILTIELTTKGNYEPNKNRDPIHNAMSVHGGRFPDL